MPELREVFEMATKEVEPDVDMRREQERRQRRVGRNRKIGAFAVAAAIGVVAIVLVLNDTDDTAGGDGVIPVDEPTTVAPAIEPGFALYDLTTGETTSIGIIGAGSAVDVSPDGTKIAYSGDGSGLGATVHVANVDGSDVQEFAQTGADSDAVAPRWSPDGTKIVYQGKPFDREIGNVYVLEVATGRVEQISHLEPTEASWYYMAPTFSADGQSVVFMKQNRDDRGEGLRFDLLAVPATGGEATVFQRGAFGPDFSPNGGAVAFSEALSPESESPFGDLYVARPDGSGARKVADGPTELARWSPDGSQLAWSGDGAYLMDVETGTTERFPTVDGWIEWVDEDTWMIEVGVD